MDQHDSPPSKDSSQQHEKPVSRHHQIITRLLHGKEKDWQQLAQRSEPLQLLDLPVDILKEIVNQITHTNDLTSLALTHSALHALAIPQIYSRFDIVWPDDHTAVDSRSGVDALTYGLATLVMARDVFGEARGQRLPANQFHKCTHCGRVDKCDHSESGSRISSLSKTRRGNHFAEFTRKFSLGNGPADWVSEYQINKEGGKMLGTLVALAVGRMRNLETFVWDMPTGVLRDVWIALASLGDREDGRCCRLERVWVRWHDNSEVGGPGPPTQGAPAPSANPALVNPGTGPANQPPQFHIPPYPRVEFPTFSILPPLRSLSVLDIDEFSYVEEMSILLECSVGKLRELRLGVAAQAQGDPWIRGAQDQTSAGPPTGMANNQVSTQGGILGILFARLCTPAASATGASDQSDVFGDDIEEAANVEQAVLKHATLQDTSKSQAPDEENPSPQVWSGKTILSNKLKTDGLSSIAQGKSSTGGLESLSTSFAAQSLEDDLETPTPSPSHDEQLNESTVYALSTLPIESESEADPLATPKAKPKHALRKKASTEQLAQGANLSQEFRETRQITRLELVTLELERVPISIPMLSRAIDWSCLSSLTILGCRDHEQLWKALRRKFTPLRRSIPALTLSLDPAQTSPSSTRRSLDTTPHYLPVSAYPLTLRRLQTDSVSPSLIAFIRDTLAPDSLEWLFLQQSRHYTSPVSIDTIYRSAIRRHKLSLRKLLVESEDKSLEDGAQQSGSSAWRRWIFSRELLSFITSGKMTKLRELGIAVEYRDWHFFLQRLPQVKSLRSLFIPHVADHIHGRSDSRELAMQIVDIVALKPELELCYLGIQAKCFEILEYAPGRRPSSGGDLISGAWSVAGGDASDDDDGGEQTPGEDDEDGDSDAPSSRGIDTDTDDERGMEEKKRLFKLREILFYDDKVSIFRARHGRL